LVSATEHFDTQTPIGRMVMRILAIFAEFERDMIIDRVIGGMERKAARGGWTAGSHPFGYSPEIRPDNTKTGFLVPNEHAALVPIIFDLYGRRNLGARAIADWLNQRGHRTRKHKPWNHKAVLQVLRNRAYIGEIWFRGTWHPAPTATWSTPTCSTPSRTCSWSVARTSPDRSPTAPTTTLPAC
jgi:site-specific DNA recombinase